MKNRLLFYFTFALILCCLNIKVTAAIISNDVESKTLYKEEKAAVQVLSYKNSKISISNKDIYLMAQIVCAESRAEPYNGKVAVASVIVNRLLHPQFPKTVEGVVKQKGAFSCVVNGKINVNPDEQSFNAVFEALNGKDPTNKAVFFYNPKTATCKWMKSVKKSNVKPIGNHVFFVVKS